VEQLPQTPIVVDNIPNISIEDEVFSIEDINFRVDRLEKGKDKDTEGYQDKILKIGGSIFIPHIHKLFNLALNKGFHKPSTQSLIVPIFKSGDKINPSNYMTVIISPIFAKLYGIILEKKTNMWLECHRKGAKGQARFK